MSCCARAFVKRPLNCLSISANRSPTSFGSFWLLNTGHEELFQRVRACGSSPDITSVLIEEGLDLLAKRRLTAGYGTDSQRGSPDSNGSTRICLSTFQHRAQILNIRGEIPGEFPHSPQCGIQDSHLGLAKSTVKAAPLRCEEGSAARQGRAREGSQANLVTFRVWNLPSHDLDFVSIVLPS